MPEDSAAPDGLRVTDVGNAQRFVNHAAGEVRYVREWGCFIVYRAGQWVIDVKEALVTEKAKGVAQGLMALVPTLNEPERSHVFQAARRAESAGALAAMIRLARGIDGVLVDYENLDADPTS